jgi:hypothetical protein
MEGGISCLAVIEIPDPSHWEKATGLGRDVREAVLNYIGEELVIRETYGKGHFLLGENVMTLHELPKPAKKGDE